MLARTPEECLLPSLDKPSLEGLSYLLRHPEQWPEGFVWNYDHCAHCAMGLAHQLWRIFSATTSATITFGGRSAANEAAWDTAMALKMSFGDAAAIFADLAVTVAADVTPELVADAIDAYLARA